MKVLFLTMSSKIFDIRVEGIYTDLMRKFRDEEHEVYIIAPFERRTGKKTSVKENNGVHTLGVRTLNVTKTNILEKGVGQILLEHQFSSTIKKYWKEVKFDLILYSTPPITFTNVIEYVKKCNPNAVTYLLLKDIFPQNAVDLGMMSKTGLKRVLYSYFRKKEKKLYHISDYIGCMSPANVQYVLKHNPEVKLSTVEIAPNSYENVKTVEQDVNGQDVIRQKYQLPVNKPIFLYGGNMGKPQGIQFFIECMNAVKDRTDCYFVIVGSGTEYSQIESWFKMAKPKSVSLFNFMPKIEYDKLANACDVGLIFLDYRFTIPNYPSRLLPYLMTKKPIIAVTDPNCDTGSIAEDNGYGLYCPSNSVDKFVKTVDKMLSSDIKQMGENGYQFYLNNYTVQHTYDAIMNHLK